MKPLIYKEIETKGFGRLLEILEEQGVDVKLLAFMIWAFRTENFIRKEYHYRSGGKYLGVYIKNLKEIFELTKKIADANFIDAAIERIKKIEDLIDDNLNIAWNYRIKGSLLDIKKEGSDENYKKCYRLIEEKFPDWKNRITENIFIRICKISGGHAIRLNRLKSRLNRDFSSQFFNYIFNDTFGVMVYNKDVKGFKPAVFLCDIIEELIREYKGLAEELYDFLFINWGSGISRLVQRYYYNNLNDEDKKRNNLVDLKLDKERISIYKDYLRSLSENKSFPALIKKLEVIYEKNFTVEINPKDITIISARSRGRPKKASDEIELETLINSMLKKNNIALEIIVHVISFLGIEGMYNAKYNNEKWELLFQDEKCYNDSYYLKLKRLKTIKETALKIGRFTYNDILKLYNKEFKWDVNDTPLSAHCKICKAYKYENYKGCLKNMNCNLYYSRYAMSLDLNPAVRKWFFNF